MLTLAEELNKTTRTGPTKFNMTPVGQPLISITWHTSQTRDGLLDRATLVCVLPGKGRIVDFMILVGRLVKKAKQ